MRQISNIIDIEGEKRDVHEIKSAYYKVIEDNEKVNLSPRIGLNKLLYKYRDDPSRLQIINYCIENLHFLIIATPQEQQEIINEFYSRGFADLIYNSKSKIARNFSKNLIKAFCYKEFRQTFLLDLAKQINIKVCPYCNSQYTLLIENSERNIKLADFQFDHFFSKAKYPYLSISFFNLIPSCSICNLRKSQTDFNLDSYAHPYLESISDYFRFIIKDSNVIDLLMANKLTGNKIEIHISDKDNIKVKNQNLKFNLEEIYGRHKDIVRELYIKSYAYNKHHKEQMLKWKKSDGSLVFKDMGELDSIILGNYSLQQDINKRPLSKFTQDIARSAGLIE